MSTKRRTRPPAGDNLEFIFPDEPRDEVVDAGDETQAPAVGATDDVMASDTADRALDRLTAPAPAAATALDDTDEASIAAPDFDDPDDPAYDDDRSGVAASHDEDDVPAALDGDLAYDDTEPATADEWAQELEALEAPEPMHAPRVLHVEDVMSRSYGFTAIARSLLAIVALYALLALSIRLAPSHASAWFSRIPLAGALLARGPALVRSVELRNVAGAFQELRNARRVFVITGEAVNHSPASIDRIEVEATLYDGNGRIDQKVVSAGNRTTLRDLSENEIALLQRLNPRRVLAPGESSTFLIVFLEPPRTLREFSSRVLNVRPTRRLARPASQAPAGFRRDSVG